MQEYKITIPYSAVDKVSAYIEKSILEITTGFSYTNGFGAWKDNADKVIYEAHRVYYIAIDDCKYDIFNFARELRRQTGESCIYVVKTGEAYLV